MAQVSGGGSGSGIYTRNRPAYFQGASPPRSQAASAIPARPKPSPPKPAPRPAPRPAPSWSPPRNTGGGGGYRGAPSVGAPSSVGRSSTGRVAPVAPPKPPPAPPSLAQWLKGDSAYLTQQSALARALKDYQAQMGSQRQQYQGQYDLNLKELGTQREGAFEDLENDYASRGLLQSGVYGTAYSDLENDYKRRQTDLDTARANFLANLGTGLKNYQTEQSLTAEKAKQEAIARRAAKYNL